MINEIGQQGKELSIEKKKKKKHLPGTMSSIEKRQSPVESISQNVEEKSLKSNKKGTG